MIAAPHQQRRTGFLRLAMMLAALVGVALIQGAQCHAASMAGMIMPTTGAVAAGQCGLADDNASPGDRHDAAGGYEQDQHAIIADDAMTMAEDEQSGVGLAAGLAMACLAIFLAVLTVLAIAGPVQRALLGGLDPQPPIPVLHPVLPRPPSLAQLCILRT
ncbi:hypothetical protein [Nocardia sp. NPDC004415]